MNKKSLKSYCATALIVLGLALPAMAEPDFAVVEQNTVQQTEIPSRVPISRKALAMKFILAMLGVGASSVIIYVGLSVYNRFIYGTPGQVKEKTEDEEFKTPNNMKDALDIFLKKTK